MMGAWEKSLDEVLLKFGVTKEKLQENAASCIPLCARKI